MLGLVEGLNARCQQERQLEFLQAAGSLRTFYERFKIAGYALRRRFSCWRTRERVGAWLQESRGSFGEFW
jgi:hypothetical protein